LLAKANKLENDLRDIQGKMNSLKEERDRRVGELNELQRKFDSASRARDELIEKLRQKSRVQATAPAPQPVQPAPAPVIQNNDAYWGAVLKEKADLEIQLSGMQKELKNLQISNEALQREKNILEIDINSLRNEKKDLLRQLDYNQKLLDSISQEVVREKNDKVAIQDSLKTLRAENYLLTRQLKSLISRKEVLDKKVQGLQEGKSVIEKRLSEMETILTDRLSKVDSLKSELDTIKSSKAPGLPEKKLKGSVELPAIVVRSASSSAEKTKAPEQEFPGKILAVNLDSNFVVIDLGSSAGARAGDIFNVYRAAKSIGSIRVIQARANISACDIKQMSTPLKIGDKIK
jgi:hypothetical protein